MRSTSTTLAIALAFASLAACDKSASTGNTAQEAPPRPTPPAVAVRDAGPPADRTIVRRVITFYRWQSTEPGGPDGQGIEHGAAKLHLVLEMHRDPSNQGWVTVSGLAPTVNIPESARFRSSNGASEWHVPPGIHTEFSLEQFGGEMRGDEPVRVFLASAPGTRVDLPIAPTPAPLRLPATATLPATSQAATGQYDAIVVFVIPMSNRHGGRYLLEAVDMLAQPGGFPANGVMSHAPSASEIERYARWMRDRNGIGHSEPPIALAPIDR